MIGDLKPVGVMKLGSGNKGMICLWKRVFQGSSGKIQMNSPVAHTFIFEEELLGSN